MQNRTTILKAGAYAGFAGAAIFIVQAVFTSTSSTAAIGLIMIPFYGFPAAGAGWALVYSAFALLDLRSGKASWNSRNVQFSAVFLAILRARRVRFLRATACVSDRQKSGICAASA